MSEFSFYAEVPVKEVARSSGHPDLPPVLQEIEGLIGHEATMKLVDRWGGLNLYVPESMPKNHRISRTIGADAAQALADVYGGDTINMPRAHIYHAVRRQMEIFRRHRSGEPVEKLAAEYGVTWRAIYKMVSRETVRLAKIRYAEMMRERGRKS
jgi:Mor family transcriptional regulator